MLACSRIVLRNSPGQKQCKWRSLNSGFFRFCSVQLLSHVQLFATPWTAAGQASLSITNSWNLLKLMSIKSLMPPNHLILCRPLLLPSIFPSIRVFSNESVLSIKWPKYWSFSFNISPSNEYSGLISFRMGWLDLLAVQGTLKSLLQHHSSKHQLFGAQISLHSSSHLLLSLSGKLVFDSIISFYIEVCYMGGYNYVSLISSGFKGFLSSITEKAMAPHSSTLAWQIPWMEEPGGLQAMGCTELDTTEWLHFHFSLSCTGEGSGNPLQCSCLENPRDGGAWWAAVYGVAQSRRWLKRLSSSSSPQ